MAAEELTVIGRDTRIKGEMFFDKGARILGQFEGRIEAQGEVQIGEGAMCEAAVEAETIVVDGTVQGDLVARGRLTLNANSKIRGDLTAGTLVVVEGATFVGHVSVGPQAAEMAGGQKSSPSAKAEVDFKPPWRKEQAAKPVAAEPALASNGVHAE